MKMTCRIEHLQVIRDGSQDSTEAGGLSPNPLQEVYEGVWRNPRYRQHSPGAQLVEHFLAGCQPTTGCTIVDVGCGTGRMAQRLAELGFAVTAMDLAANAPDATVTVPFVVGDLTRDPVGTPYDWVICTDVLEHLTEETVPRALEWIGETAHVGAYLQISTRPSVHLGPNGETLHLAVHSPAWWSLRIDRAWGEAWGGHVHVADGAMIMVGRRR